MNTIIPQSDIRQTLHATPKGPAFSSGPIRKAPHVAKGHDAILKNLQDRGALIHITTVGGEAYHGKMINRDRYTITIRITHADKTFDDMTVYKHAIESFSSPTAAA